MSRFTQFGNALYTGERSFDFVGNRVRWYAIGGAIVALAIIVTILRGGFTFGIEFSGGSEFRVSNPTQVVEQTAIDTVEAAAGIESNPRVSIVGGDSVRVQTEQHTDAGTTELRAELAQAYDVPLEQVTASFIGATWGQDITRQALIGLAVFLVLVSIVMALYFRTWKMSLAALTALAHDLLITGGIYGVLGYEITPAAVIGLLLLYVKQGYRLSQSLQIHGRLCQPR